MTLKIILTDRNPVLVDALRNAFAGYPDVSVELDDIISAVQQYQANAWITPTNSRGIMSGGIDAVVKEHYAAVGVDVEPALMNAARAHPGQRLPVGRAVVIDTFKLLPDSVITTPDVPRFLIAVPTMAGEKDDLRRTKNTARAIAAAFQAIYEANNAASADAGPDTYIETVVIPGLGTGTGRVTPVVGAELMLVGYKLFLRGHFPDWKELDEVLAELLADAPIPNAEAVAAVAVGAGVDKLPI